MPLQKQVELINKCNIIINDCFNIIRNYIPKSQPIANITGEPNPFGVYKISSFSLILNDRIRLYKGSDLLVLNLSLVGEIKNQDELTISIVPHFDSGIKYHEFNAWAIDIGYSMDSLRHCVSKTFKIDQHQEIIKFVEDFMIVISEFVVAWKLVYE